MTVPLVAYVALLAFLSTVHIYLEGRRLNEAPCGPEAVVRGNRLVEYGEHYDADHRAASFAGRFFVGIKCTNRPEEVMRLSSVLVTAPEIRALVAAVLIIDDGIDDHSASFAGAHQALHYLHTDEVDVGLGAGRNMLTAWATELASEQGTREPLFLTLDDDFVIDDPAAFQRHMLLFGSVVDAGAAEIAGGGVINVQPSESSEARERVQDVWADPGEDQIVSTAARTTPHGVLGYVGMFGYKIASHVATVCTQSGRTHLPQFPECVYGHRVVNFFTARLAWLRAHPWDDELKLQEHTAFFFDAWRANARVAYCPGVTVLHDRTPIVGRKPFGTAQSYNAARFRAKDGLLARAHAKRNLTDFIYTAKPGCAALKELQDTLFVQAEDDGEASAAVTVPTKSLRRIACRLVRERFGTSAQAVNVVHLVAQGASPLLPGDRCWPAADAVFDVQLPATKREMREREVGLHATGVRCGRALTATTGTAVATSLAKQSAWCRLGDSGRPVVFVLAGTLSTSSEPSALVDGLRTHLGTYNGTTVLTVEGERDDGGKGRWNAEELRQFLVSRFLPLSAPADVGSGSSGVALWSDWPALTPSPIPS
jgi:hypothetical protein